MGCLRPEGPWVVVNDDPDNANALAGVARWAIYFMCD
jgi:hypothetical protein